MTDAIEAGYANAKRAWKDAARKAVVKVARRKNTFTVEDVRKVMLQNGTLNSTGDLRALGGVMLTAKKLGVATPTGTYVMADGHKGNPHPVAVWQSGLRK